MAMRLTKLTLPDWAARLLKGKRNANSPKSEPIEQLRKVAHVQNIGRYAFAFGVDWEIFESAKEFHQICKTAYKEGQSFKIRMPNAELVGFTGALPKDHLKAYAAAVHLAETVSLGNIEVFFFALPNGEHSLIALNDSKPVSHLDLIGKHEELMQMLTEFLTMHSGQAIRVVSNSDLFEDAEKMSLEEAFGRPDDMTRLTSLPNYKLRKTILWGLLPVALVLVGLGGWYDWQLRQEEKARLAQQQDPNFIYEQQVEPALQTIKFNAQDTLGAWLAMVKDLPIAREGWQLVGADCLVAGCTVKWTRFVGSYNDFYNYNQLKEASTQQIQTGDQPATAMIESFIAMKGDVSNLTVTRPVSRASLPLARPVLQTLGAFLQDMSLLKAGSARLLQPKLFPETGAAVENIQMPVVKGEWSTTQELWVMGDLVLPDGPIEVQKLSIYQDEKKQRWLVTLTGNYYAKGKNF